MEHSHASLAIFERFVHQSFGSLPADGRGTFAALLEKGGEATEAFQSAFVDEGVERTDRGPQAFADFEIGLQKRLAEFGRGLLCNFIEERDENDGPIRRDGRVRSTEPTPKTIHTVFGAVRFLRSLYRSPGSPALVPVDESLGLFDK